MKKLPRPEHVFVRDLGATRILRLEWEFFALEMYEDEALVMARTIYDVLEEAP